MLNRDLLNQITAYMQAASDPTTPTSARLEFRLLALIVTLQATIAAIEALQRFYDDADVAALMTAAAATEPLDENGRFTKRSIAKYLALLVSYRTWSTTAISGQVTETPRQLLSRQPEKIVTP